jgi:hypothetical protein
MPSVLLEPATIASEQQQTHVLDQAATGIDIFGLAFSKSTVTTRQLLTLWLLPDKQTVRKYNIFL